ncbi:MAG TPA: peptide ABC transporter substrate-binding protein [Anaerolineaceae bacterium]
MYPSPRFSRILLSLALLILLAAQACQPAPAPTLLPSSTPTPTLSPSSTPIPSPTAAPLPTSTPVPSPTPTPPRKVLRLPLPSADLPVLDPPAAEDDFSIQLIEETSVGVLRRNEVSGELENGMATRWSVSPEGITYTFTLRDDIPWVRYVDDPSGGRVQKARDCEGRDRVVTAYDFAYGILRAIQPATNTPQVELITDVLSGAATFRAGKIQDPNTVGVRATDRRTLEVTFREPAPAYGLTLLSLWITHPQPAWLVEGDECTPPQRDGWADPYQFLSYGPYTPKPWKRGAGFTLVRNPFWQASPTIPSAAIDEIQWLPAVSTTDLLREFDSGAFDLIMLSPAQTQTVLADPRYQSLAGFSATQAVEFLAFNTNLPPVNDLRVRQALSLSIDRQKLISLVIPAAQASTWFTPPANIGTPAACCGTPGEAQPAARFDLPQAKLQLARYLNEKQWQASWLKLTLAFNAGQSNQRLYQALQEMWRVNLGVEVKLVEIESLAYARERASGAYTMLRSSWLSAYPDAHNYLALPFGKEREYANLTGWVLETSPRLRYLNLLEQAQQDPTAARRSTLYARAEQILLQEEAVIIPLFWHRTAFLAQPYIKKSPSQIGMEHFEKWDIPAR